MVIYTVPQQGAQTIYKVYSLFFRLTIWQFTQPQYIACMHNQRCTCINKRTSNPDARVCACRQRAERHVPPLAAYNCRSLLRIWPSALRIVLRARLVSRTRLLACDRKATVVLLLAGGNRSRSSTRSCDGAESQERGRDEADSQERVRDGADSQEQFFVALF